VAIRERSSLCRVEEIDVHDVRNLPKRSGPFRINRIMYATSIIISANVLRVYLFGK